MAPSASTACVRAEGTAPSSISTRRFWPATSSNGLNAPVMVGPTRSAGASPASACPAMPLTRGAMPQPMAMTSPLVEKRWPRWGEQATSLERSKISVLPNAPAASTTVCALTHAVRRVVWLPMVSVSTTSTAHRKGRPWGLSPAPSATGFTDNTVAPVTRRAPWRTACGNTCDNKVFLAPTLHPVKQLPQRVHAACSMPAVLVWSCDAMVSGTRSAGTPMDFPSWAKAWNFLSSEAPTKGAACKRVCTSSMACHKACRLLGLCR